MISIPHETTNKHIHSFTLSHTHTRTHIEKNARASNERSIHFGQAKFGEFSALPKIYNILRNRNSITSNPSIGHFNFARMMFRLTHQWYRCEAIFNGSPHKCMCDLLRLFLFCFGQRWIKFLKQFFFPSHFVYPKIYSPVTNDRIFVGTIVSIFNWVSRTKRLHCLHIWIVMNSCKRVTDTHTLNCRHICPTHVRPQHPVFILHILWIRFGHTLFEFIFFYFNFSLPNYGIARISTWKTKSIPVEVWRRRKKRTEKKSAHENTTFYMHSEYTFWINTCELWII